MLFTVQNNICYASVVPHPSVCVLRGKFLHLSILETIDILFLLQSSVISWCPTVYQALGILSEKKQVELLSWRSLSPPLVLSGW